MEMVWGTVRRALSSNKCDFRLSEVEDLTCREPEKYDESRFAQYVRHTLKEGQNYRRAAPIFDELDDIVGDVESGSDSEDDISMGYFEKEVSQETVERLGSIV